MQTICIKGCTVKNNNQPPTTKHPYFSWYFYFFSAEATTLTDLSRALSELFYSVTL